MAPGAHGTAERSLFTFWHIANAYREKGGFTMTFDVGQVPQKRSHCPAPVTRVVCYLTSACQQNGSNHAECVLSTAINAHKGTTVVNQFQREQQAASDPDPQARAAPCFSTVPAGG